MKWGSPGRKWGDTIKWTELLHIKTDILKLQFCIHLWKKRHISPAAFISLFRMQAECGSLQEEWMKSACRSECDHKLNQGFANKQGAWTESKCFLHENFIIWVPCWTNSCNSNVSQRRQSPLLLGDFCDLAAKIAILTPSKPHFARFKTTSIIIVIC